MSQVSNQIKCPNCGQEIDVNDILYHQLDDELRKQYNDELAKEKSRFEENERRLAVQRKTLESEQARLSDKISEGVVAGIKQERAVLETTLKKKAEEEQADRIATLQTELKEKSEKVKDLNRSKAEIEKLKREKDELRETIELESQKRLTDQLAVERTKIQKAEESRAALRLSEKEHVINQLREQLQEAQRKAEQGSMQVQGEVLELAIEEWLKQAFPLDTIEEIKKGARGADCLQVVNTTTRKHCGTIYYESKRTKSFQPIWIEKFKNDIRDKNADVGVLVTEAMPTDMERMGQRDGIWICTFDEFKGLCPVLRESLIQISTAVSSQENKGEKMEMLYNFLTSNEFRLQVEGIVEGFTLMQGDLESEKRAMQGIWKKREKQIEKVILNTNHMYSSIKGIAGSAIQTVSLLELDHGDLVE
jgi:hypothetical protein